MGKPIRVLVVDDMAVVRQIIKQGLSQDPDIEVVGTAADAYAARDLIIELQPDVMTLDIEMPRMNGVQFLRRLMPQHPMPVVMVSSLTRSGEQITLDSLAAGAVDFVTKPLMGGDNASDEMMRNLIHKIHAASTADIEAWKRLRAGRLEQNKKGLIRSDPRASTDRVIAIGASTGGTEAIEQVVSRFPSDMPPVLIVQHMPAGYTQRFAERLDRSSAMQVREAEDGNVLETGVAFVAPGDSHLSIEVRGGIRQVKLLTEDRVSGHRPSVDVLFSSVSKHCENRAVGVLLTGMGHDGAAGLLEMRQSGARTVAQDESTSIVFGMPKTAIECGAAENIARLSDIADVVASYLE